jgi:hypothetical protein
MKIKKMNDEECLNKFVEFLQERVGIDTIFVADDRGNGTHQILKITCGEFVTYSNPEPLAVPVRPATAEELGETVN